MGYRQRKPVKQEKEKQTMLYEIEELDLHDFETETMLIAEVLDHA